MLQLVIESKNKNDKKNKTDHCEILVIDLDIELNDNEKNILYENIRDFLLDKYFKTYIDENGSAYDNGFNFSKVDFDTIMKLNIGDGYYFGDFIDDFHSYGWNWCADQFKCYKRKKKGKSLEKIINKKNQ